MHSPTFFQLSLSSWIFLFFPAAFAEQTPLRAPDGLRLEDGRAVVYEGKTRLTQRSGTEVVADTRLDASLLTYVAAAEENAGMRTLVLARSTHGDGAEPSGIVEHYAVGERSLLRATMPPQELDEVERNLNIYFPLPLLPRTPSEDGKATVRALGQIPVEGKFRSTMDSSDDAITHTFELASPAKFSFNRKDALLDAFKEVHVIDKERGIVERFSTTSSIALGAGDDAVRVDIEVDIVATRAEKPAGVNGYILEKSLADLAAIEEGFRERKASSETAPRVDDLLKRTNETDFRALGHAAAAHLAAYRSVLETDGQGELLRRLLGKAPPDFELEGLDGKRVRLRDAIRGKVAYLNFWGVG